ncbi:MAG: tetrahydrofolate dehydrogenase/cyclohydrolase catalytic domain-containing protein [Clostridia bacterium]|jgi:methylenetetrahydrofolate dehydrogenase (NADP+)/methenyltetrahydrofolate cyclohydrolase|nr:tetrahydrofolate dehydrogenase/cyclohydrolase catalytic domain-containing protein [Clostridia bacterium]
MSSLILDGKALATRIEEKLKERVTKIIEKTGITPILATIIVGNDVASVTYVRMKGNACMRVGIEPLKVELPESTTTEQLLEEIYKLNRDDRVCGILLQHPVPKQIDEQKCFNSIDIDKDVDGVNVASFGAVTMGIRGYRSATPYGIITILKEYAISLEGKHAVVIGRSAILGKPVAMLLLNENATVTICHSKTVNLPDIVKTADIVVAAVGRPEFVKADWVKEGAVLVDAGYNAGNIGDIDLKNSAIKSSAYTPVPGGVGPMTITMLMSQTVDSAERKYL